MNTDQLTLDSEPNDVPTPRRRDVEDAHFRILRLLAANPSASQRDIAAELGLSLGRVNYCLRGLAEKGLIKVGNFRKSKKKMRYAYMLTPAGLTEKSRLAARFLKARLAEYDALRAEIEALTGEPLKDRPEA